MVARFHEIMETSMYDRSEDSLVYLTRTDQYNCHFNSLAILKII